MIKFVDKVIPQYTMDYSDNLKKLKPDFVVHGDDWKTGIQKNSRSNVIKVLKNGHVSWLKLNIRKISHLLKIKAKFMEIGTTPEIRKSKLSRICYNFKRNSKNIRMSYSFNWSHY